MRSLVAIVLSVVAVVACAQFDFNLDFLSGLNLTRAKEDFSYRYLKTQPLVIPSVGSLLGWVSASVDSSSASTEAKAKANAMVGLGVLPGFANPPFALLAYGKGSAAVDVNIMSFLTMLFAQGKLDANFEVGAVALAPLSIQEYDNSGAAVGEKIMLSTKSLINPCQATELHGDDGNVTGLTCSFSPADSSAVVTVTYLASLKAGVLGYGKTPVSPNSLEMIVRVGGFPLSQSSNHIRMEVGLFSASGAGNIEGNADVVRLPFAEDLYSAVADRAIVDDRTVEVVVNIKAGSAELGITADAVLKATLGDNFDVNVATIDFPAGARNIVYDPVVGYGKNVYDAVPRDDASSSSSSGASQTTGSSSNVQPASGASSGVKPASASSVKPASSSNGTTTSALSLLVALVCVLVYLF